MEKRLTYFDYAEDDFLYLKERDYRKSHYNATCHLSSLICERYLKHIIDVYTDVSKNSQVMQTHSIKVLKRFIENNIPTFKCDWGVVLKLQGLYFEVKYPGDNSYMADLQDAHNSVTAVEEVRDSVILFIHTTDINNDLSKKVDLLKQPYDAVELLKQQVIDGM